MCRETYRVVECSHSSSQVRWVRGDGSPHSSRHVPSEEVPGGTRHVLTIRTVHKVDFGTYLCRANSFLGNATGRVVLSGEEIYVLLVVGGSNIGRV